MFKDLCNEFEEKLIMWDMKLPFNIQSWNYLSLLVGLVFDDYDMILLIF